MADELPGINDVDPEDPGYAEFLDTSLRAIEGIINKEGAR